jgi:glycosyltransferase involved in cell wall biosynthesis
MNLLFDLIATQPSQGKFHGAGEYAKSVFSYLIDIKNDNIICGIYNPDKWLDPDIQKLIDENNIEIYSIKKNSDIVKLLKSKNFHRFYTALPYDYYNTDFSLTDFVYTLHGLRDLEMPTDIYEFFYERNLGTLTKWLIKTVFPGFYRKLINARYKKLLNNKNKNTRIITASNHTKYSIINHFPEIDPGDIMLIYSPRKLLKDADFAKRENKTLKKFNLEKKNYILLIGGNRWIKNSIRGIQALDEIFSQQRCLDKKAVVVGGQGLQSIFLNIRNKESFVFTDYIEDFELEILYKNSHSFLYPTLNEGFGYPPLEAMKYGIPVICSAISSVTEICGNAAIYFNPFRRDEIKNRLLMLLLDNDIYSDYSKRSLKQYKEISKHQDIMLDRLCKMLLK